LPLTSENTRQHTPSPVHLLAGNHFAKHSDAITLPLQDYGATPEHFSLQHPHCCICCGCYGCCARAVVHERQLPKDVATLLQVDSEVHTLSPLQHLHKEGRRRHIRKLVRLRDAGRGHRCMRPDQWAGPCKDMQSTQSA
jgi:hypothetical protein